MRTTLNTLYSMMQNNLDKLTTDMTRINNQISSGRQMSKISDDPVNLVSALRFRSSIKEIEQYSQNLSLGETTIVGSETALREMKDLALRAKELNIQAMNPSLSISNRQSMATEIKTLHDQAILLANSRVSDKYLFGGYRTTGYTKTEPSPFINDKGDGHWVNGTTPNSISTALTSGSIATAASSPGDITAGDILINGVDIAGAGDIDLDTPALDVEGINMGGASNLAGSINTAFAAITPAVTAALTTLTAGSASLGAAGGEAIDFTINGVAVSYVASAGTPAAAAQEAVDQINLISGQTGVTAELGTSANGGTTNSVVLKNMQPGNDSAITLAGLDLAQETNITGLANADSASADATHNTGQISLSSPASFSVTSNAADDSILDIIGLGGGEVGVYDTTGDGQLIHGPSPIGTDQLKINGIAIDPPVADGLSTVFADASAAAKVTAINLFTNSRMVAGTSIPGTGVSAEVIPATTTATNAVQAGTMDTGDLTINGIDIFTGATTIVQNDQDNALITAINAVTDTGDPATSTGVKATRNSSGQIILSAVDGRNIKAQTSANGEFISNLTGGEYDNVSFGSIQIRSDRIFTLEDTDPSTELGFKALGLSGGESVSGEPDDVANDGKINVYSIHNRIGSVRYAGDREGDLKLKVGKVETIVIGENGKTGVADTGIFDSLKNLEEALLNQKFTSVTSSYSATDTTALLDSGETGMERALEYPFVTGTFRVTVTDHDYYPPKDKSITIAIDPSVDTLESVTGRMNGIANISASLNADGELEINAEKPERYTFSIGSDTSNFTSTVGIDTEVMQFYALTQSLDSLDETMALISEKISNFGAKTNRLDIQTRIFSGLELAARENLSEVQDTDLIEAITQLKSKEVAYQATLAAAAKTMQLSLIDYL